MLKLLLLFVTMEISFSFELTIIHTNDFHARYEETNTEHKICKENCFGGFSRMYEMVKTLRSSMENPLVLNAGDNFYGTMWHTIYGWNVTQHFLNLMDYDVITLGNHEFDDGVLNLSRMLKKLKTKIVCSNVFVDEEPILNGLVESSATIEIEGKKIGFVGVTTTSSMAISRSIGRVKFSNEIEAVNKEAIKLIKEENCFTVIVLSHVGYQLDLEIAQNSVSGISVIVGGHSHTLLHNGDPPLGQVEDDYPKIELNENGKIVLIVQAFCCTFYVGNLKVKYDEKGDLIEWEGNTRFLGEEEPENEGINEELNKWRKNLLRRGSKVIGKVQTEMENRTCRKTECLLANLITNAMSDYWEQPTQFHHKEKCKPIAMIHAFGLRDGLEKGVVTYGDMIHVLPFSNRIDLGKLKGIYIWSAIEQSFFDYREKNELNLLQQSGLRIVVNSSMENGEKIQSIQVCCDHEDLDSCKIMELDESYFVTLPEFLMRGKDHFEVFKDHFEHLAIGPSDINVMKWYFKKKKSCDFLSVLDGRIEII